MAEPGISVKFYSIGMVEGAATMREEWLSVYLPREPCETTLMSRSKGVVHTQNSTCRTHMVSKQVLRPRGSVHDEPARIRCPGGDELSAGTWSRLSVVQSCRDAVAACWKPGPNPSGDTTVYTAGCAAVYTDSFV